MTTIEGVYCGNYRNPNHGWMASHRPCRGVVILDPEEYGITRHMFHPYDGSPPIHCGAPAAGYTFHRKEGYS